MSLLPGVHEQAEADQDDQQVHVGGLVPGLMDGVVQGLGLVPHQAVTPHLRRSDRRVIVHLLDRTGSPDRFVHTISSNTNTADDADFRVASGFAVLWMPPPGGRTAELMRQEVERCAHRTVGYRNNVPPGLI